MKKVIIALTLPFIFCAAAAGQDEKPLVEVLDFHFARDRRSVQQEENASGGTTPARAVIAENKYFQRKAREQLSPGAVDPNTLTVDGRSAELDRITREAGSANPRKTIEGYSYSAKFTNSYKHPIKLIFWQVQFTPKASPASAFRRQFICPLDVKPGDKKELSLFTTLGPEDVVSAADPTASSSAEAAVSRVEFADGAVWQRLDWDYAAEKPKILSAIQAPWRNEVCRVF
jgi:hypothetical protein